MKKTFVLFILFLAIIGFSIYLTTQKDTKTTLLTEQRDFAVANIADVHKVFLADRNGNTITLERKKDYWQLNEKYRANPNAVQHLLDAIEKVKIKFTPPNAAEKNIITDIATRGIKIEIYNRRQEKIKAYYVGGVTNDELGTYMVKEDAETPFVMYIPGFEGTLRIRYTTNEKDWRDKTIFQEKLNTIQTLSIEYPKQKNQSFKIEQTSSGFQLSPFYKNTPILGPSVANGKIERYLLGFEKLIAESFSNTYDKKDSIRQLLPFSIIRLKSQGQSEKVVKLHPIIKRNKAGQLLLNDAGQPIIERYFADVDGTDFMLIQQLVFGKILWGYDSFYQ